MEPAAEAPTTAIVVDGGRWPDARVARHLPPADWVLAADSGADHARGLGLRVDLLIGDLDSVTPVGRQYVEDGGGTIEAHPTAKDESDLELALRRAVELGASRIVVVGGGGGRADHDLIGLLLLGAPWLAGVHVSAWRGASAIEVIRPGHWVTLHGWSGGLLTLLAVVDAFGVSTEGLAYPLHDEPLTVGSSRGLSNVMLGPFASVRIAGGTVLAIRADALDPVMPVPQPPVPGPPAAAAPRPVEDR